MGMMRRIRLGTWILGLGAAAALNAWGSLPRVYKGEFRPVGEDVVSVYTPGGSDGEPTVPVVRLEGGGFKDTGERVRVFLRNDYRWDGDAQWYPRATLCILTVMLVVALATSAADASRRRR